MLIGIKNVTKVYPKNILSVKLAKKTYAFVYINDLDKHRRNKCDFIIIRA